MPQNIRSSHARIVYAALSRITDDRVSIQQAFTHWAAAMGAEPLDNEKVASLLSSYLGLGSQQKNRFIVAMHAAGSGARELDELPGYLLDA